MSVKNQVQLITYPDSLGGNLRKLHEVLEQHLPEVFKGGIHILPPFPSSGDRGFAPLTYLEIEPEFGSWEDIRAIGEHYDVLVDLMVNHISAQSEYFQDFLKHGRDSHYADLFITLDKIWENGEPVAEDIDRIFLRRPVPYSAYATSAQGLEERVWTTFGKTDPSEQVDLDLKSELTKELLTRFFENFKNNNIKIVRLDAVGYVIKKLGTSCFFVEPEIWTFMDWIAELAERLDMELLPEVHAHHSIQYKLAERGYWIYDFILPYRILETLLGGRSSQLLDYLRERPSKQFTMLDCHDGVPVKPDMDGLIDTQEARKLVDTCLERGANLSLIVSDEHKAEDGFDVHQIRGSYYSLLGCDDNAYLAARAIQFFTPGIPQVYYVGLLAGKHDNERVQQTGEGREINRHNYSMGEIESALGQQSVQRLIRLIRFRNDYAAFQGAFSVESAEDHEIRLSWSAPEAQCELYINLSTMVPVITYIDESGAKVTYHV
ncbi:sucrose phosphorylase [Paenibacillus daejeonensis]|uniref:sucrose phosphorylase n=1 Tax=Paenibacillus daejeonensis TaxID=135193 RepID=UPI000381E2D7|nr:sucrose phosphorylase [Paenibacillus daejeonensis]